MSGDGQAARTVAARYDIAVVGAGVAGMSAALEARRAGATVIVLEAGPTVGGNAAISSGYVAFADTRLQRESGITDSPAHFLRDLQSQVARERQVQDVSYDVAVAERFAAESPVGFDFLEELGIEFGRWVPRPLQHTANRLLAIEDPEQQFRDRFGAALNASGVDVVLNARAHALECSGQRVSGVEFTDPATGRRSLAAAGAVILATGGFQSNHELRARYQAPELAAAPYLGIRTCAGDGHLMAERLGADLINMEVIPSVVQVSSAFVEDAIAVNSRGARFHDEAGPYERRVEALVAQPNRLAHYIFDAQLPSTTVRRLEESTGLNTTAARTLRELAARIRCDATGLERTVAAWNRMVASGCDRDPAFDRVVFSDARRVIRVPPFYAIPMIVKTGLTAGGLRVSERMEVCHTDGTAIEGLFAAGDCTGAFGLAHNVGGTHISAAIVLGRVAGREGVAGGDAAPAGAESVPDRSDLSECEVRS